MHVKCYQLTAVKAASIAYYSYYILVWELTENDYCAWTKMSRLFLLLGIGGYYVNVRPRVSGHCGRI